MDPKNHESNYNSTETNSCDEHNMKNNSDDLVLENELSSNFFHSEDKKSTFVRKLLKKHKSSQSSKIKMNNYETNEVEQLNNSFDNTSKKMVKPLYVTEAKELLLSSSENDKTADINHVNEEFQNEDFSVRNEIYRVDSEDLLLSSVNSEILNDDNIKKNRREMKRLRREIQNEMLLTASVRQDLLGEKDLRKKLAIANINEKLTDIVKDDNSDSSASYDSWYWHRTKKTKSPKTKFRSYKEILKYSEDFQKIIKDTYNKQLEKLVETGLEESGDEYLDPYHLFHHILGHEIIYMKPRIICCYKLKDYKKGDGVIIELNDEQIYDGFYVSTAHCNENYQVLILKNVCVFPNINLDNCYQQSYYFSTEIKDLRILPNFTQNGLTYNEYLSLKILAQQSQLLTLLDCRFREILNYLKKLEAISLLILGSHVESARFTKISYLVIGTPKKIYIFDLITTPLHFLEMGLRDILEDPSIQKIVIDGKIVADILKNRCNINLVNIYDIGIGDYCISRTKNEDMKNKNLLTYPELADKYLNIPPLMLEPQHKLNFVRSHYCRPCSDSMRWRIGLAVVFMIPIRRVQLYYHTPHFYRLLNVYAKKDFCSNSSKLSEELIKSELFSFSEACDNVKVREEENNKRLIKYKKMERRRLKNLINIEAFKDAIQ